MATDFYRQRLAHALWTWRESKHAASWRRRRRHRKDRIEGRREKRRARQREAADIALDAG